MRISNLVTSGNKTPGFLLMGFNFKKPKLTTVFPGHLSIFLGVSLLLKSKTL